MIGVVAGLPLGLMVPWLQPLYLTGLSIYAIAVLAGSLAVAVGRRAPGLFPKLVLVFATIHFASGAGMLLALLELPRRIPHGAP